MLDLESIERLITKHGGSGRHEVQYAIAFYLPMLNQHIYLNKQSGNNYSGLIVHPRYQLQQSELLEIDGVSSASELNHKSSYRNFPTRYNRGKEPIPYGVPFGFESEVAFDLFMQKLKDLSPLYISNAEEEISSAENDEEFAGLNDTEKKTVVNSRRGQGKYRESLISLWGGCSVTGCTAIPFLRASHIKPWRDSNNVERLDKFNGLLLIPNLDALFDGGLISFDTCGKIIISQSLDTDTVKKLGVDSDAVLSSISPNNECYLKYHRKFVFQP